MPAHDCMQGHSQMAAFEVILGAAHHEEARERDGERARVGRAQPLAELEQVPPQKGRREHASSLSIVGIKQHIQSSAKAFGTHQVLVHEEAQYVLGWHQAAQHQPERQEERKAHLQRTPVCCDRRHVVVVR